MSGALITFEGIDGVGKTLQVQLLEQYLQKEEIPHLITKEPGGTDLGIEIMKLLEHRNIDPTARAMLFQADRAAHLAEIIQPALERGLLVICDRYIDSSICYQEVEGLEPLFLELVTGFVSKRLIPNMTFLLDLPVQLAIERSQDMSVSPEHLQAIRERYLSRAKFFYHRFRVVDAMPLPWIVHNEVCQHFEAFRRSNTC